MLVSRKLLMGGVDPEGWNLADTTYDSKSFSVSSQEVSPQAVNFNDDGSKMYVVGRDSDTVYEYDLSTEWDVSSASYNSVFIDVVTTSVTPNGMVFKPDGTKMYVLGNDNTLYQYSLSTAWDLGTASYDSVSFNTDPPVDSPQSVTFKPDGTKMYMSGAREDKIWEFDLSTAWDLTTSSYNNANFTLPSFVRPSSIRIKPDGVKIYFLDSGVVYQYSLTTAWNITSMSNDSVSEDLSSEDSNPTGIAFKPDGFKLYMIGSNSDSVHQYSVGEF